MTKRKKPEDKQKVGRKCILDTDPVAVGKLEGAFAIGADVTLACSHAGISRDTYYEYIKKHPEKADKYAQLRRKPILKALNTIVGSFSELMRKIAECNKDWQKHLEVQKEWHKIDLITRNKVLQEIKRIVEG